MLRKIKLYGHLREHTGLTEVEAYVDNVREAVNFLTCNWPKLKSQIAQNNYHVLLDEDDVGEEELLHPIGNASISFIPVVEGSGKFGKILAGAALIGLSLTLPGGGLFGTYGLGKTSAVIAGKGAFLTKVGTFTSAIGASSAFSSPLNVTMPGVAVPLVYGTAICGSIVINTSLEIGEVEA